MRNSGTENKIRVLVEGSDTKVLKEMFDKIVTLIKRENG
ncbi:MAG: hypothetical protein OIF32_10805 [Campylobacterales bacterium]|nr:hypothetical protein [Campylobacterales bacterium]